MKYEAVQFINGETYIYRGGRRDIVEQKNLFRFTISRTQQDQYSYGFTRFDFNPCTPMADSFICLNPSAIMFSWELDPQSDIIKNLEKAEMEMDAAKAGIVLP